MTKSSIWKVLLIVFAAIGVVATIATVAMLIMHTRMMGASWCC